jgi:hypothetical protein
MLLNSSMKVDYPNDVIWSMKRIEFYESISGKSILLLQEHTSICEHILSAHRYSVEVMLDDFKSDMKVLEDFIETNKTTLEKDRKFIDENFYLTRITCMILFNRLTITERIEIAKNMSVDMGTKRVNYMLFVSMFNGISLDIRYCKQHPHLMSCRGVQMEIIKYIVDNSDEEDIRARCDAYSKLMGLDFGDLLRKCSTMRVFNQGQ